MSRTTRASSSSWRFRSVTSVYTATVPPSPVLRSLIWIQRPSACTLQDRSARIAMAIEALPDPILLVPVDTADDAAGRRCPDDLLEGNPGFDDVGDAGIELPEPVVAQHQPILGIEQGKSLGDRSDGQRQAFLALSDDQLDALAFGDIGIGGEETATGHRIAANLHHRAVGTGALEGMRLEPARALDTHPHLLLHIAVAVFAPLGVEADEVREMVPGFEAARRKVENFKHSAIEDDDVEARVEQADTLVHAFQGHLQNGRLCGKISPPLLDQIRHDYPSVNRTPAACLPDGYDAFTWICSVTSAMAARYSRIQKSTAPRRPAVISRFPVPPARTGSVHWPAVAAK